MNGLGKQFEKADPKKIEKAAIIKVKNCRK